MKSTVLQRIQSIFAQTRSIGKNEPLSWPSLIIIVFLDIFVLIALFQGLADQTKSFVTPEDVIPYSCQDIAIYTQDNTPRQKTEQILTHIDQYGANIVSNRPESIHPTCRKISDSLGAMQKDTAFIQLLETRAQLQNRRNALQSEIKRLEGSYNTILLERNAQTGAPVVSDASMETIRQNIQKNTEELAQVIREESANFALIEANPSLQQILPLLTPAQAKELRSALTRLEFTYPLKRLAVELLFLLPLFLLVWLWNNRALRREKQVQTLISAHLLVVIFIPIFFKIAEGLLDIIPRRFLEALMKMLADLHLLMFWYYFLILLAIGAALLAVYVLQKKIFNKKRLIERRVEHGLCQYCGKRIREGDLHCPFCSEGVFRKCTYCQEETYQELPICRKCWQQDESIGK